MLTYFHSNIAELLGAHFNIPTAPRIENEKIQSLKKFL
jgi:hypothetical protein